VDNHAKAPLAHKIVHPKRMSAAEWEKSKVTGRKHLDELKRVLK